MKTDRIREVLSSCPLFSGVDIGKTAYERLFVEEHYTKGQKVSGKESLCILVSGRLRVGARNCAGRAVINELQPGAVFGYASLFDADGDFDSDIRAAGSAAILRMRTASIEELIEKQPAFARNVIAAQAEKIRFLNRRIDAFSAPDGETKLMNYLSSLEKDGGGAVVLPVCMAALAKRLGLSRASLYRVVKKAEKEGRIQKIGEKRWLLE